MPGYIPKTVLALVEPAVQATAARLFVLTTGRAGSARFKPAELLEPGDQLDRPEAIGQLPSSSDPRKDAQELGVGEPSKGRKGTGGEQSVAELRSRGVS